ncbi:MAG: YfiR family protein [Steroidobacteraceae bacterium]
MLRSTRMLASCLSLALIAFAPAVLSDDLPEYRLKAAFLYNFALFTEWPADTNPTLNLCVYGRDPFGEEIDALQGKAVGDRHIAVRRVTSVNALSVCQIVFIADPSGDGISRVLTSLRGATVLTITDTPGAAKQGVALNMSVVKDKITFEANLTAARAANLKLSSKLLSLATEVLQ